MKTTVMTALTGAALLIAIFGGAAFGQSATPSPPPLPTIGGIPPPPPPPGGGAPTSTPAPTATATPQPTATNTPIPLTINLKLAHRTVAVNTTQKVTVTTLPGAAVSITVTYPNHRKKTHHGTGNSSGKVTWSYKQASGVTTAKSRTVSVHAVATSGGDKKSSTKKYTVK